MPVGGRITPVGRRRRRRGRRRGPRSKSEETHIEGRPFSMSMSNVAPAPWTRPLGTMDKDGLSEIEVRKRRILKRTPMASAATPASQQALVDAGAIVRVGKG